MTSGTKAAGSLSAHEIAALHLYTAESAFYRQLNATLRHPDRARVKPYFGYLRMFLEALAKHLLLVVVQQDAQNLIVNDALNQFGSAAQQLFDVQDGAGLAANLIEHS